MLTLEPMQAQDCAAVEAWTRDTSPEDLIRWSGERVYQYPFTARQMLSRLTAPGVRIFALRRDGVLCGTIELFHPDPASDGGIACRFLLPPELRGQGLGRQGLALLADAARDAGFARLILRVYAHNLPALRCYLACGFSPTEYDLREDAPLHSGYTMERRLK